LEIPAKSVKFSDLPGNSEEIQEALKNGDIFRNGEFEQKRTDSQSSTPKEKSFQRGEKRG
jgi:hypothetical protein